jgi:SpoVK/Ycf46/Vps4 family AAA+-type ATPase
MDEVDGILGGGRSDEDADHSRRFKNQFLSSMDGMQAYKGITIIGMNLLNKYHKNNS